MRYTQEQIDRYEAEGLDVSGMLLPDGYGDHGKVCFNKYATKCNLNI